MAEEITPEEITKAAHNLGRLAQFVGARRHWTVTEGGLLPAEKARKAGKVISEVIYRISGGDIAVPKGVELPPALEPADEISVDRLARFADYLDQLRRWFLGRSSSQLPSGLEDHAQSIQRSLAATDKALSLLLEGMPLEPEAKPKKAPLSGPPPLTRPDLGTVVEVNRDARLILDHTWQKPLLQKRGNITELTPETVKKLDTFFDEQGLELNSHEKRRLYEKVQRWIESTPNQRVLVLRMSGLSGKPDVVSSFQPREDEDDAPVKARSIYESKVTQNQDDEGLPDLTPSVKPRVVAPPAIGYLEDSAEDVFRLDDD